MAHLSFAIVARAGTGVGPVVHAAQGHGARTHRQSGYACDDCGGGRTQTLALRRIHCRKGGRRRESLDFSERVDRLGEAHALLGATETGVTDADWPVSFADVAEADGRAIGVGFRSLAPDLVKTKALAVAVIAKLQGKAAGVKMRTPLAVFVDQPAVSELGPGLTVQRRWLTEGQQIEDGGEEVVGIGRTTGNVDYGLAR